MTLPTIALTMFGGDDGWRWALAMSGIVMAVYGVFYWFAITDGPTNTHSKPRKTAALEVSTWADMIKLIIMTIPLLGILSVLVWRVEKMGYIDSGTAWLFHALIAFGVIYQIHPDPSVRHPQAGRARGRPIPVQ